MNARRLFSVSAAEKLLAIQHGSLRRAQADGAVRLVPWGKRYRISDVELERLVREGLPTPGERRKRARPPRPAGRATSEALRNLNVEDL